MASLRRPHALALLPLVLSCLVCLGCGGSDQPPAGKADGDSHPRHLQAVALDDYRPHQFVVKTRGVRSNRTGKTNSLDETLKYVLWPREERLVAELQSLRISQLQMHRGSDVSMLMAFAKQPYKVMRAAVDQIFETPYTRFEVDKHGQDFNHELVASRESILIIGDNASGVISLFLAPRSLETESWTRTLFMPTNDGVRFRGDLNYKVLANQDADEPLVSVVVSGTLSADGQAQLIDKDDMPVAFEERRAAKCHPVTVEQSSWTFKGILKYSRSFRQWASGSVRTSISMRINTEKGVTQRESDYLMELIGSEPHRP